VISISPTVSVRKHRVSFRLAATVFRDPNQLSIFDVAHNETEDRWVTMGIDSNGILRVVVHTFVQTSEDSCEIRIISARKAAKSESKQYHKETS
jgi:uncharacterized protein